MAMVCLQAALLVQLSVSAGNGWPHNALWHHWLLLISCHFRDCKALLVTSLTHVSGAITGVQTLPLSVTFTKKVINSSLNGLDVKPHYFLLYPLHGELCYSFCTVIRTKYFANNVVFCIITVFI